MQPCQHGAIGASTAQLGDNIGVERLAALERGEVTLLDMDDVKPRVRERTR
jgi:hypothetical protein